jgi:hypothetical protein
MLTHFGRELKRMAAAGTPISIPAEYGWVSEWFLGSWWSLHRVHVASVAVASSTVMCISLVSHMGIVGKARKETLGTEVRLAR